MRSIDWAALKPLPTVAPWNKGRRSPTWEQRRDEYASLPKEPLAVTAELVTPVIHAERGISHLDSILAAAALTAHPVASSYDTAAVIPLPLALAWISAEGLPLWCCTPLSSLDAEAPETREYWHKRYPSHRAEFGAKLNANTSAGRWKEYRTPVHAQQACRLQALCIGNAEELRRLLAVITHIGKKGSAGYGRVARWSVEPARHTPAQILLRRAVPVDFYAGQTPQGVLSPLRGWTPPYWYAPWWRPCMVPA